MIGLLMSKDENVAVVTSNVRSGDVITVEGKEYSALQDILQGHKIAVRDISAADYIMKYGKPIGRASVDIKCGEWVHCHNVEDITEEISRKYAENYRKNMTE